MYLAFMASGLVDLLAFYVGAPPAAELVSGQAKKGTAGCSWGLLFSAAAAHAPRGRGRRSGCDA
jgi:hypothetical protein